MRGRGRDGLEDCGCRKGRCRLGRGAGFKDADTGFEESESEGAGAEIAESDFGGHAKKAHLNGRVGESEWAFVQLPAEGGDKVDRLRRWLYGMRPAARAWDEEYAARREEAGYRRGRQASTDFHDPIGDASVVVHGDDFTTFGPGAELDGLEARMRGWYSLKLRGKSGLMKKKDDKDIRIWNRKVDWGEGVLRCEADPPNAESVIKGLGLQAVSKGLDMPVVASAVGGAGRREGTRGAGRRALPPDRRVGELCRGAGHTGCHEPSLRRDGQADGGQLGVGEAGRVVPEEVPPARVRFPGPARREGGASGVLGQRLGQVPNDPAQPQRWNGAHDGGPSWSNRQGSIATSSGEAENYGAATASAEGLRIQSLAKDLG